MITEDYVSFETAKLLKEKGFDGPCNKMWKTYDDSQICTLVSASWFVEGETVVNRELVDTAAKQYAYEYNLNNKVEGYLAPSLQMAMKWLREKKCCPIEILWHFDSDNQIDVWYFKHHVELRELPVIKYYDTYEEACEAAIKYCLENLI